MAIACRHWSMISIVSKINLWLIIRWFLLIVFQSIKLLFTIIKKKREKRYDHDETRTTYHCSITFDFYSNRICYVCPRNNDYFFFFPLFSSVDLLQWTMIITDLHEKKMSIWQAPFLKYNNLYTISSLTRKRKKQINI